MIKELKKQELNYIKELENSFSFVIEDINSDLDNNPFSHFLLYIEDDKILGFINYYLLYEKIEIAHFNVLEEYQNKKIGSKLLEYIINKYKGIVENITLEVKKDNNKAIHIYEKMGFKKVAVRNAYYNGIDGILMERKMM